MQTRTHNTYYYRDNNSMLTLKNQKINSTIELCKKNSTTSFLIKILTYHQSNDKIIFYSQKLNQRIQNIQFKLTKTGIITESTINFFSESNPHELIKLTYKTGPSSNKIEYGIFTLNLPYKQIKQIIYTNHIPQNIKEFDEILLNILKNNNINLNNNFLLTNIINKINIINSLNLNISPTEQDIINNSLSTIPKSLSRTKKYNH